ncbi:hypothetical protein IEQ34_009087 [Dendrobium chrysotoxum]|uniref:Uncharacterized protein n=1 Tax=Dendrobium chrysotoxum TaxID=161865 RepID=A0AAV7GZL6_DENCH|nr:hypothetical protein IEQ34_009087 [Dendrobium chrysotoxum]
MGNSWTNLLGRRRKVGPSSSELDESVASASANEIRKILPDFPAAGVRIVLFLGPGPAPAMLRIRFPGIGRFIP